MRGYLEAMNDNKSKLDKFFPDVPWWYWSMNSLITILFYELGRYVARSVL